MGKSHVLTKEEKEAALETQHKAWEEAMVSIKHLQEKKYILNACLNTNLNIVYPNSKKEIVGKVCIIQ